MTPFGNEKPQSLLSGANLKYGYNRFKLPDESKEFEDTFTTICSIKELAGIDVVRQLGSPDKGELFIHVFWTLHTK